MGACFLAAATVFALDVDVTSPKEKILENLLC